MLETLGTNAKCEYSTTKIHKRNLLEAGPGTSPNSIPFGLKKKHQNSTKLPIPPWKNPGKKSFNPCATLKRQPCHVLGQLHMFKLRLDLVQGPGCLGKFWGDFPWKKNGVVLENDGKNIVFEKWRSYSDQCPISWHVYGKNIRLSGEYPLTIFWPNYGSHGLWSILFTYCSEQWFSIARLNW